MFYTKILAPSVIKFTHPRLTQHADIFED